MSDPMRNGWTIYDRWQQSSTVEPPDRELVNDTLEYIRSLEAEVWHWRQKVSALEVREQATNAAEPINTEARDE